MSSKGKAVNSMGLDIDSSLLPEHRAAPWLDPLFCQLSELLRQCRQRNKQCKDCPRFQRCKITWDRLCEIAGVRALSIKDFKLFHKRFQKIMKDIN